MKLHEVYEEVDISTLDSFTIREAIPTRWVHREKGLQVRSRIVAKGYSKNVDDEDSVYASTPMFTMLRILLLLQLARPGWTARLGDVQHSYTRRSHSATKSQPTFGRQKNSAHNKTTVATTKSHVRTTQFTKGTARLLSTSPTRTTLRTSKVRTQPLHFAYKRLLHHGVC